MANKATIEANIKVTGLSELEKAESVLKSIDKALSSLGKGNSGGFSGMYSDLNKIQVEARQLEANLKDVKNVNLSNVGDKASEGLKKAGNAAEKLTSELKNADRINLTDIGTKASDGLTKAKNQADQLNAELKRASQIDGRMAGRKISEGLKLADRDADNLSASIKKSTSAERELANAAKQVAQAEKESANAAKQGAQAREQAAQASKRAAQEQLQVAKQQEKEPGKIRSAFKEAIGAYTLGNLGANAIMSAGQGIRNIFSGGFDYIKEQQTSQVAWSTNAQSVAKVLGNEMSAKEAQKFSKKMTRDLQGLALSAGNDYSMVSDAALAFYATGKEVSTAGDKKKSMMLTKDMLNLQDAGGLNDAQMQNFVQAVAKSLDQNALSSERMQQLLAANPLYDDFIKKAFKERTGNDWVQGENKYSEFTGEDVVNATHMMASLNGVKKASENMNNSLEGVIRSMKNGSKFLAGNYLSKMAEQLNKSFGGDGKLFSRLSSFFTDEKKMSKTADALAKSSSKVVDSIGKTAREFYNVGKDFTKLAKPFASGFAKDFVNEIKDIAGGVKSAYGTLKSTAGKIKDKLPKGSGKVFSDISNTLGSATGKATAFLVAIRGFSKLPGMAGVAQKIMSPLMNTLGKLPIVGKTLSGIISKITGIKPQRELSAASKMQGAADKMMAAANKMNGGGPGGSDSGATGTKNSPQIFDEDGGTFYRDKNGRVKKPFKGKGAFKGEFNPYLGMDYVPGKTTRVGRYHTGRTVVATPRSNALIARGTEILEAAQTTRSGRGRWNTLKGNTLVKLGNAGSTIASSGVGRGVSAVGRGLRGAGTFLKGGAPMMNAAFSGLEALTVMGTTKSGSLERHQGVGSAVGSGVGATIGMAAGSLLGPVGTIAGGALGGWLGGKAGEWFGGKYNEKYGKKPQKSHSQKVSEAQQKALDRINSRQWQDAYTGAMGADAENPQEAAKGYKAQAKKNYKLMEAAAKSTSDKAQEAQMELDNAIASGNKDGIAKWEKELAKEIKKDDTKKVKSASKQAEKKSSKVKDLENAVYKKQLEDVNKGIISGRKSKKEREKEAKRRTKELLDQDKDYKKAKSEADKAKKALDKAKKEYKDHNGEAYKAPKKKTGASKKESAPKKNSGKNGSHKKTSGSKKASDKTANYRKKEADNAKKATKASQDLAKARKALDKTKPGPKAKTSKSKSKNFGSDSSKKALANANKSAKALAKANKSMKGIKNKKAKVAIKTSGQKDLKKAASSMKKLKNKKTKASIKLSGEKKLGKANKDLKKLKNKKAKVTLNVSGQKKITKATKDLKKIKNKKAKVTASVSGQAKLKRLTSDMKRVKNKRAKVTASVSGQNKVRAIGKDIGKVKNKKATVSVSAVGGAKLGTLNTNIKRVKGKNVKVTAQASGQGKVQGLSGAIKQVKDKNAKVTGTVTGTDKVKGLHSAINNLKDKAVKALANVSGTSQVQALVSAINAVRSKTVTITANVKKNGNAAAGTPGARSAFSRLWTGTPSFGNTTSSPAGGGSWASNGGAKAGMYLVNDAPGTDFVEAFKLKNGLVGLFPKQRNLYVPLEEGTQVLNAKDTKKMFKLEKGTPSFDLKMPNLRKLAKGTPGQNTVVEKGDTNVQNSTTNNNTFNINVTVNGKSDDQNLANMIANAIGEKLLQQFPATEV
ncbi:hypothetical protein [Ligilactobacillus murinus]|uniref:hypothetical protein n=1 Tax=Ligilactobacillus murinus TaxID=1622 RepID=UPI001094CD13|nr:hypothetical protein [Ligilactobacillus murinus]TGY52086.1 hypothetical protein E5341_07795 [Ligilactobacillus murinus]